ncbi:ferritin-like domain-containing protein [Bdellovibrio sp. ZAP7]|uniref:ferritin-like domain-containing protein n=1 Tax=Bdellovibrio sp. ZAP7 TaxID=2231053 RepID=UPI001AEFA614|nr:ferritin-like domain-containing protein [Bdellovibrio sp. ZAP7]
MKSFSETIQTLMNEVTKDAHIESAWLTSMAHMEHLAAETILGNISNSTPPEFLEEIKAHAGDEHRHRDVILAIRPFAEPVNQAYQDLRTRFCDIIETFIMGYFGNPELVKANNRFAAYVHGAITIEQFPFQIYSAYIPSTGFAHIREAMQSVLDDETAHIQLGRKFRNSLSEADRLSLQELQSIEKEMCLLMAERMTDLIREFQSTARGPVVSAKASVRLAWLLGERPAATIAWVQALGHSESAAAEHMQQEFTSRGLNLPAQMPEHVDDEMRHARMLHRAVLMDRRRLMMVDGYKELDHRLNRQLQRYLTRYFSALVREIKDADMLYLYGAWGLEMRVFKHYSDIIKWADHVGVAHTITSILEDEAEHTQMVNTALNEQHLLNPELLKFVRQTEEEIFEKVAENAIAILLEFDQKANFTPPYRHAYATTLVANITTSNSEAEPLMELQ